jgi:hypothetical protein
VSAVRGPSIARELDVERRLRDLPRRIAALELGLDNSENDLGLVLDDLPFERVMAVALKHEAVFAAVVRRSLESRRS